MKPGPNLLNILNIYFLDVPVNGNKPPEYLSDEDDAQDYSTKTKNKKERYLTEMEGGDQFVLEYEDEGSAKTKKKKKKRI